MKILPYIENDSQVKHSFTENLKLHKDSGSQQHRRSIQKCTVNQMCQYTSLIMFLKNMKTKQSKLKNVQE